MADRDCYEVLGVARDATAEQIKKAYRSLARKYHPDVNPGNKQAEEQFKEAQNAYDILSDSEKRAQYDRYGHAAFEGFGPAGPRSGAAAWTAQQAGPGFETIDFSQFFGPGAAQPGAEESGGIFEDLLGRIRGGGRGRRAGVQQGRSIEARLQIPFVTAVRGGETTIELQRESGPSETLVVKIPPGTTPGSRLRVRGRGEPGERGAPPGDLTILVEVETHPYFQREGRNLVVEAPITVAEAVLGAKIDVPTLDGLKTLTVPPASSSGLKLRLRGKGVPGVGGKSDGDLLVLLKVVVPKSVDDDSRRLILEFQSRNPSDPRRGLW